MARVLPGVALVLTRFLRCTRVLISDDFPTFERPANATSGSGCRGYCAGETALREEVLSLLGTLEAAGTMLEPEAPAAAAPAEPLTGLRFGAYRVGERIGQWANEAQATHPEGMVLGVSHEAPLVAAYLWGRRGDFTTYKSVNIPHLSAVRLVPGPQELVDPLDAVDRC